MSKNDDYPSLDLPARSVPVPTTISDEARKVRAATDMAPVNDWPEDLTDKAAVARTIAGVTADFTPEYSAPVFGFAITDIDGIKTEHLILGDVSVYIATPEGVSDDDPRTFLALHGAFIFGAGEISRLGSAYVAAALGVRVWAVDYRMPPYHPYPVPLDDCLVAYREAVARYGAGNIAIGGTSGGGNLTLATLLRAKDEGLPMPAAAAVNTPYADLTHAGDTMQTIYGTLDLSTEPRNIDVIRRIYSDGHDMSHPYLSPLYGDFDHFPPTMLCSGTRDFLLSATVRVHRRLLAAGVEAELHVWEAAAHDMFGGTTPEDRERDQQIRTFLLRHWSDPSAPPTRSER